MTCTERNPSLRQIPAPGVAPQLATVAAVLVEVGYVEGDFGEEDRDAGWLAEKARDLGECLQGAYEDFMYEASRTLTGEPDHARDIGETAAKLYEVLGGKPEQEAKR